MALNPLTKQNISNLRKSVVALQDVKKQIDDAKAAGVDVSEYEARHQAALGTSHALLKVYGGLTQGAEQ